MANEPNARATFFGIGGTIQMSVNLDALSVNDRLSLLHRLMMDTGTTEAIGAMPNAKEIFAAIDVAWKNVK